MISVIVPIYNIENEVEKCIISIINQTYNDLEIILVDDGSTDKSLEICKKYASTDERIKVIHKENGGLVSARRAGLQIASGEYVAHIDGDDWVENKYIETLVNATDFGTVDVVIAGFVIEFAEGDIEKIRNGRPCGLYDKEKIKQFIYPVMLDISANGREEIIPSNCSKLFRRTLALEKQMLVGDYIKCDEDTATVYPILLSAESIRIIDACEYHYVRRTNSVSTYGTGAAAYFKSMRHVYELLKSQILQHEEKISLLLQLERLVSRRLTVGMRKYYSMSIQKYLFPYELISQKSRVVLYGAGAVGRDFYKQIVRNQYCEIVLWVDKDYKTIDIPYAELKKPASLLQENYDYVIVCISHMDLAQDIIKNLKAMGVSEKKVVWKEDYIIDLNVKFNE